MAYTLTRTLPDGTVKASPPVQRKRDAAVAAGRVLNDNTATSKADAQRFSALLDKAPLGETVTHEPTGYRFLITRERVA